MIKIRPFSIEDSEKVIKISKASFPKNRYSKRFFEKYHQSYPEGFIVAEDDIVIGYTIGLPKENMAEIVSLAVEPDWRGQGVGTKLTNFLLDHFKKNGFREIYLHVRTGNKTALTFYQSLDFKIIRTVEKYYSNGESAYSMVRAI